MHLELLYPIAIALPSIFVTYFGKYKMYASMAYIFISCGIILHCLDRNSWPFDLYGPAANFLSYFVIHCVFLKKKAKST